jgi:hypothetical protein
MIRYILPIIIVAVAISLFFGFTSPLYESISTLQAEVGSYNEALENSKMLENERDKLTSKLNAINPEDLSKIEKLLPQNVNNIRLILEIEKIATPYGMVIKDVKYNTGENDKTTIVGGGGITQAAPKDYGIFELEFSTAGSYNNFINFLKDLEHNLRIVDISFISFASDATSNLSGSPITSEIYEYHFKIRTYWLKN